MKKIYNEKRKKEDRITGFCESTCVSIYTYTYVCVLSDYNIKSVANSKNSQLKFYIKDLIFCIARKFFILYIFA